MDDTHGQPCRVGVFFSSFSVGDSMPDLLVTDALPSVVENWPEVAHHAAKRLRTESAVEGGIPEFRPVIAQLEKAPRQIDPARTPVIPSIVVQGDQRLSLFAIIAQFGTPEVVALGSLKIELYFPLDAETEHVFEAMAKATVQPAQREPR